LLHLPIVLRHFCVDLHHEATAGGAQAVSDDVFTASRIVHPATAQWKMLRDRLLHFATIVAQMRIFRRKTASLAGK
jgi:hypothetical protein